jgi:hypothetical protein
MALYMSVWREVTYNHRLGEGDLESIDAVEDRASKAVS